MSSLDLKRRVVVTGLGVVSSIGIGWQEFWKNLLAGKSGISRLENFDTTEYDRHFAGEVKVDLTKFLKSSLVKKYGRTSQMTLIASEFAIKDAGISLEVLSRKRSIVGIGTTAWEMSLLEHIDDNLILEEKQNNYQKNILVLPGNTLSVCIAEEFNLCGVNAVFGNACSSGNYAVGLGFDYIQNGMADFALVGGADSISRVVYTGFVRLLAVAIERCQPFDLNRQGMIPGEGAGILFLESLESAQERKAPIYAEIIGCGMSCDAHHMTYPDFRSVAKAMGKSLKSAGIKPEDVDYISAHGTGTVENDKAECAAYFEVFGHLKEKMPMSSIKSMLGHTMGAAGALESIVCCLAIDKHEIPATINLEKADPFCEIDCVANESRKKKIGIALNNSQAFGGNNACLVFKGHKIDQ